MKPYVRGKSIFLREVCLEDAELIIQLRTDPEKSKHLSSTQNDLEKQQNYISNYLESLTDYYFIICNWNRQPIGTVRIYDIREDSFCWGSWIISKNTPNSAAIESALLIYDFAFFSLHYSKSHFDVRKDNHRVVDFHKRFGANIVSEDEVNFYFEYTREKYMKIRNKYLRFIP